MNPRPGAVVLAGLVLLAAGCSTTADVQTVYDQQTADYHAAMARAQEWNTHVLGIPASGWVAILITSAILGFVLLVCAGVWIYRVQERRAEHRLTLARKRADVDIERARRGACPVCAYNPAQVQE